MKSPFEEWGAVPDEPAKESPESWGAVPDEQQPQTQDSPSAWGAVPQPASQDEVHRLISDPKFDPASYAIQTGDTETAFQARQALKNQSWGDWAARVGETLADPATLGNALAGAGKFVLGGLTTIPHTIAQGVATAGAYGVHAVGANDAANWLENEQQTQGAESTLAGQQVEQNLRNTARNVADFAQHHPIVASAAYPMLGTSNALLGAGGTPTETDERVQFEKEIQAARNAQSLAQDRPLETGVVASLAKAGSRIRDAISGTGINNLSDVYSPEALKAQGARPVSHLFTESAATFADPQNLLLPLAAEIPGVKTLAGGITQGLGKVLQAPEAIMSAVPKVGRFGRMIEGGAGVYGAVTHPAAAATAGAAWGLGKVLGFAGRAMDEQGAALRSGVPSALDATAQSAASAGKSAIGTNIQRIIGNTANNVVATALGFAPVNYVTSDEDPRAFAQSEAGAGVMGGVFGLAGDHARLVDTAQKRLAPYGSQQFTENPMWQAHQAQMAKFSPDVQSALNALRGTLFGGTGTDVLVLDGQNFAKQVGAIGGDARGQFAADPNGGTVYLNADAIGKGGPLETAGHESGHAVVDFLKNAGREGDAQAMFSNIADTMTPEQVQAMTQDYTSKLAKSTPGYEKGTSAEKTAIEQKIAADNPPEKMIEENLAEITRRLLSGKPIARYALPQPILERVMDAAARFMEGRGWMPSIDLSASLGFKAQMVNEAARRMNAILYETGKTASAAMDKGPTVTQQLIEAKQKLADVQQITPNMPVARATAIQRQRDAAQKEINDLQGLIAGKPANEPPAPNATTSPTLNRYRIAAILRRQGLNQADAKQWADAAEGNTDEEAVVDALRKRGNQKFPTTITKQEPNVRPVSSPPPNEPVPAGSGGVQSGMGGNTTTAEPVSVPAKNVGGTAPPTEPIVHTTEDFDRIAAQTREQFLSDKTPAKAGKNKGQHTAANQKAADKAAFDASAEAHAATVPTNYQGMRQRIDAFGKKTVSGQSLDPSLPFDAWLISSAKNAGNMPGETLETIQKLIDAIGTGQTFDYGHAPVAEEGEQPTGESRAAQQAQHAVKKRLSGESPMQTEAKTSIPLSLGFNSGTNSFTVFGASPEKLLNNFNHISEALGTLGATSPYRDINDPRLVADMKAVIRNHQNGWQGDGSRPAVGTAEYPNVANPDWANSPERTQIPEDRFNFVNMMLGDEGAKAGTPQAKAMAHLANENRRLVNEAGETNELRQQINDAIPWKDKNGESASWSSVNLEDPLNENISPALASNVREASQSDESIRQHGKAGDLGRFFDKGQTPNRAKTAAGFLPAEESEADNPPFYSQLHRSIESIPQNTMTVAQARAFINKGAKPAEISQQGILTDPLSPIYGKQDNDRVRKADLLGYSLERQAKVQDVTLGGEQRVNNRDFRWMEGIEDDIRRGLPVPELERQRAAKLRSQSDNESEDGRETHFSQYQLPGADEGSYRESFVTWPGDSESLIDNKLTAVGRAQDVGNWEAARKIGETVQQPMWHDGHGAYADIANPIVRLRTNLRTDAEGKKTFFLEEMQGPAKSEQAKMPPELRKRIYEIGMKRAIRQAVDEGADAMGWTTGDQQTDRYDLSKQLDKVSIGKTDDGKWFNVFGEKNGQQVIEKTLLTPQELVATVGKELASKAEDVGPGELKHFEGEGLRVGGEGLKNLYDVMLPRIANKIAEKVGGKTELSYLRAGDAKESAIEASGDDRAIHSLPIPDAWKQSAPSFSLFLPSEGEDTGSPEEGSNPGERLGREAESAGIPLSMTTMKGLMQQDQTTMDNIRRRIEQKTGKPARFMPTDTMQDDLSNQSTWMNNEAKRRGFSTLDDLLESDPSQVTKMAAQWRQFHPRDEQGMLLQNDRVRAINSALYGDEKSDTSRPAAGARDALGNAASFLIGNAPASESGPWDRSKEQSVIAQNDALVQHAKDNGLLIGSLPPRFEKHSENDVGGGEHHVWPGDETGRWIKSTRGTRTGVGMGSYPMVKPDGQWELTSGTPVEYLKSRELQNQVFGDDVRMHAIQSDGKGVSVITSQPHVTGEKPTQPQIDGAMESAGFSRMDDATYYRKSDNVAVFDLHPQNAFIHNGALLPIDAIVLHPSEELLDALKDSRISILNRRPSPPAGLNPLEAARFHMGSTRNAVNFMPGEEPVKPQRFTPGDEDQNAVDLNQAPWVQRFQHLINKEDEGSLKSSEEQELQKLHTRMNREYPGGFLAWSKATL